jgi:hypothetical protein
MFGGDARRLLELMGMSGRIPSAAQAADLPAIRARLLRAIDEAPPPAAADPDEEERETPIPLRARARPLLAMLDAAIAAETWVMWEETR